ncbi:MAG: class I tRNA ligase family protein, partial [Chloroflexota bacterium]|nr:class I tRNA ligase family protein [Chloroflexota bacterium]
MSLTVYNTLIRKKVPFNTIEPGRVSMYVCGPTVYDHAHIGHGKLYISMDMILRYLRYTGLDVLYVQNITDVGHLLDSGEDRIMKGARREQTDPMQIVERYMRSYMDDMDALHNIRPDIMPRAAGHVPEQIAAVDQLIKNGNAYEVNGSVYFDVSSFPEYGKLSGRKIDELQEGTRLDTRAEKRRPEDFALWKRADPEHIMRWS